MPVDAPASVSRTHLEQLDHRFRCPGCGAGLDDLQVAGRLSTHGYLHNDVDIRCPTCDWESETHGIPLDEHGDVIDTGDVPDWKVCGECGRESRVHRFDPIEVGRRSATVRLHLKCPHCKEFDESHVLENEDSTTVSVDDPRLTGTKQFDTVPETLATGDTED